MSAYVWPVDNWHTADGATYTGRRLRQMFGALFTRGPSSRPLGARTGVLAGTSPSIVTAAASGWTVAPHRGVIDLQDSVIAGAYQYSIDQPVTGSVPAANASQDRVDLIVVQVSDPTESDGSQAPGIAVNYVPGSPGQGAPATPAHGFVLARVTVPAAGQGVPGVAFVAKATTALGGIVPARTVDDYPESPYLGQYVDDAASGLLRWDGSKWSASEGDTGWITSGVTGVDGNVVNSVSMRRKGSLVDISSLIVVLSASSAAALKTATNGNTPNIQVATITDARFIPTHPNGPLQQNGSSGRMVAGYVDGNGGVFIGATAPNSAFSTSEGLGLCGLYLVD